MSNTRPKQRLIDGLNSSTGKANQHDADVLRGLSSLLLPPGCITYSVDRT